MNCSWSVFMEVRGDQPSLVGEDALAELATALVPASGIVTGGGGHPAWGATVSVDAATAIEAVTAATAVITEAAARSGLPSWPVAHAEVTREDVLDEQLSRPAVGSG